jgi:hypothetical protein
MLYYEKNCQSGFTRTVTCGCERVKLSGGAERLLVAEYEIPFRMLKMLRNERRVQAMYTAPLESQRDYQTRITISSCCPNELE